MSAEAKLGDALRDQAKPLEKDQQLFYSLVADRRGRFPALVLKMADRNVDAALHVVVKGAGPVRLALARGELREEAADRGPQPKSVTVDLGERDLPGWPSGEEPAEDRIRAPRERRRGLETGAVETQQNRPAEQPELDAARARSCPDDVTRRALDLSPVRATEALRAVRIEGDDRYADSHLLL